MSTSTMTNTTSGQVYLFFPILRFWPYERWVLPTKECLSCNLLWICWSQLSCQRFKIYFIIKGLKSLYGIEPLNTGSSYASLSSWSTTAFPWIPIWLGIYVKMTYLSIATRFLKFQLFLKWKGFEFYNSQFTLFRRDNELQSKTFCISFF